MVVWNNQQLQCEDITGYEVHLYNPGSGLEIYHQIPRFLAHYVINDEQLELNKTYVQVYRSNRLLTFG